MKHNKGMVEKWYPLWIDKWLWGSMRHELIINKDGQFVDLRGIFTDLMTLSQKDSGYIRANENTPYPLEQLAGMFCVPIERLKQCIDICCRPEIDKLKKLDNGMLFVTSYGDYELSKRHIQRINAENVKMSGKSDTLSQKGDAMSKKGDTRRE